MEWDESKPYLDHLDEFRSRLLRCLAAFALVLGAVVGVPSMDRSLSVWVFRRLTQALLPGGTRLVFLDAFEPAWVLLKVAVSLSAALLSPYIVYHLFAFFAPAFSRRSRGKLAGVALAGAVLFLLGMLFAYFIVLPASLRVLMGLGAAAGGVAQLTLDRFYTFVLTMLLVFGIPFEMPLVLAVLVRLGVLGVSQLRAFRKPAILGIVVFSAVVTPDPTPFSQLALSSVLIALYELSIAVSSFFGRASSEDEFLAQAVGRPAD